MIDENGEMLKVFQIKKQKIYNCEMCLKFKNSLDDFKMRLDVTKIMLMNCKTEQ